jgi:hypothetical protein
VIDASEQQIRGAEKELYHNALTGRTASFERVGPWPGIERFRQHRQLESRPEPEISRQYTDYWGVWEEYLVLVAQVS